MAVRSVVISLIFVFGTSVTPASFHGSVDDFYASIPMQFDPSSYELDHLVFKDIDDGESKISVLPLSLPIGQVTGLGIDSNDHLYAFHRAGRVWNSLSFNDKNIFNSSAGPIKNATIYVIDRQTGRVLEEHGKDVFYMPHGLSVDHEGNIWVTDVALHQVMKLNKKFEPMLTLGERLVPGNDSKHFCQPTDVAVASSGEFFVADGYCNSRVMKFDKNGEFIASFGHANEPYKMDDFAFWIPHSLALIEDMNLICVADRENERIQCFSAGIGERGRTVPVGVFITKAENVGRVFAIREKFHNLVGVTGSDGNTIESQVFVMDINNGRADTFAKGIVNAHALEVSNDGVVYIGLIGPNEIVVTSLDDE